MPNATEFNIGLDRWFDEHVEGAVTEAVQKIGLDLLTRVVLKTPVDTGRARGNWMVTIGSPTDATTTETDKSGQKTINEGSVVITGLDYAGAIWIVNNVPYAEALENGHSGKAPAGMLAVSLAELETFGGR